MAKIQFWRGTTAQFNAVTAKDADTLYFITDDPGKVYLGTKLVGADDTAAIASVNSTLTEKINADIKTERDARIAQDGVLQTNINNEKTAREGADTALGGRIDSEAAERAKQDGLLDGKITAETSARTSADTALGNRIDAEVTAREGADTTLQNNINAVSNKIGAITDATVKAAIDRLDAKDTDLQSQINGLLVSGGAMVYIGVLNKESDFATFVSAGKVAPGATFTINYAGTLATIPVEVGDMVVYTKVGGDGSSLVKADLVVVQANLSGAVQSSSDTLTDDTLVLGNGNKNVKTSSVTLSALNTAIDNANNSVQKTGNQTMAGSLTSTGGFIGSLTGNASGSAGSLKNAQKFSITGGATAAAVSFNGTDAVSLNVTSLDASKLTKLDTIKATSDAYGTVKLATTLVAGSNDVATSGVVKTAIDTTNLEVKTVKDIAEANKTAIGTTSDAASESGSIYARIAALKATVSGHATRLGAVETIANANTASIRDLTSNLGALDTRVTATEAQLTWLPIS